MLASRWYARMMIGRCGWLDPLGDFVNESRVATIEPVGSLCADVSQL